MKQSNVKLGYLLDQLSEDKINLVVDTRMVKAGGLTLPVTKGGSGSGSSHSGSSRSKSSSKSKSGSGSYKNWC